MAPMPTCIQVVHTSDLMSDFNSDNLDWLTHDELARYQSISSANRKLQFLAGHFLVRKMASRLYGNQVADWIYFIDADNRRRLECRQSAVPGLYVSLSHSGDWIAAGISAASIGIDIETCGKQRDFIAIASHVFSKSETMLLKSLAPDQLARQFYLYWTLKECVAKQCGAGLKFEVSRAHSFIPSRASDSASIISWQCPQYVLAVSSIPNGDIETSGLCGLPERQYWLNVSA